MQSYKLTTYVDITRTNAHREDDYVLVGQQRNFDALVQGIGLRANVFWDQDPYPQMNGEGMEWIWTFHIETEDVFVKDGDPVGLLLDDLHGIPIELGLQETANIDKPILSTKGEKANIKIQKV